MEAFQVGHVQAKMRKIAKMAETILLRFWVHLQSAHSATQFGDIVVTDPRDCLGGLRHQLGPRSGHFCASKWPFLVWTWEVGA